MKQKLMLNEQNQKHYFLPWVGKDYAKTNYFGERIIPYWSSGNVLCLKAHSTFPDDRIGFHEEIRISIP